MSVADATACIRQAWDRYFLHRNDPEPEDDNDFVNLGKYLKRPSVLLEGCKEEARDCGWCIAHSHGMDGLHAVHDTAIEDLDWDTEGYHLSRLIDRQFNGILNWSC
jgi:hypothetical protein